MGWAMERAGPGEAGPEAVAETTTQMAGRSWSPSSGRVFFKLYKNVIVPIIPIYTIDKRVTD